MPPADNARVRYIFTYGTLMSTATGNMGAAERALLDAFAQCLGPVSTRGAMFRAGACPGVVLGGRPDELVQGELWHLPDDMPDLLAALDAYEGCAPHCPLPHPYARQRLRIRTPRGNRVTAWVYVWAKSTEGLVRIADGRWRGPQQAPAATLAAAQEVAA